MGDKRAMVVCFQCQKAMPEAPEDMAINETIAFDPKEACNFRLFWCDDCGTRVLIRKAFTSRSLDEVEQDQWEKWQMMHKNHDCSLEFISGGGIDDHIVIARCRKCDSWSNITNFDNW